MNDKKKDKLKIFNLKTCSNLDLLCKCAGISSCSKLIKFGMLRDELYRHREICYANINILLVHQIQLNKFLQCGKYCIRHVILEELLP